MWALIVFSFTGAVTALPGFSTHDLCDHAAMKIMNLGAAKMAAFCVQTSDITPVPKMENCYAIAGCSGTSDVQPR